MAKQATEQADGVIGEEIRGGQGQDTSFYPLHSETFVPSSLRQTFSNQQHLHQTTWTHLCLDSVDEKGSQAEGEAIFSQTSAFCRREHSTLPVLALQHQGNSKINGCASERDLNVNNEEGTKLCKAH